MLARWIDQPKFVGTAILYFIIGFVLMIARFVGWHSSFASLQAERPTSTLLGILVFSVLGFFAVGFLFTRSLLHHSDSTPQSRNRSSVRLHGRYVRVPELLGALTRKFDDLLLTYQPGNDRDRMTEEILQEIRDFARSNAYDPAPLTVSDSPGHRLAAIIMLQVEPDFDYLHWLAERLTIEKKILGLEGARAILSAARIGDISQKDLVSDAISSALYANYTLNLNPDDPRRKLLEKARAELNEGK